MFFYLAKIVWFAAQPTSAIVLVMIAGIVLLGTRWQRLGRRLLVGGLAVLVVIGLSPISDALIVPLENRFPRADLERGGPVTGIIVLGGAEDRAASAARTTGARRIVFMASAWELRLRSATTAPGAGVVNA